MMEDVMVYFFTFIFLSAKHGSLYARLFLQKMMRSAEGGVLDIVGMTRFGPSIRESAVSSRRRRRRSSRRSKLSIDSSSLKNIGFKPNVSVGAPLGRVLALKNIDFYKVSSPKNVQLCAFGWETLSR